jgi:glycosyltransferase involved in cell wall biosynthesis
MSNPSRVAHLTSVHPRYDARIFGKQCRSLAAAGYSVALVVADGKGDETRDGVAIFDVGRASSRLRRMMLSPRQVLRKALALDAAVYHLHDPELMPIGLKLKRAGKRVIFDAHEDLPKQIHSKPYLNAAAKVLLSHGLAAFERLACGGFDAIVAATPSIGAKFARFNSRSVVVNNFPILGELELPPPSDDKPPHVVYVGGIAATRGIREMVHALEYCKQDVRLRLGGSFEQPRLRAEVAAYAGWRQVDELGYLQRHEVARELANSRAGLVLLHPTRSYTESQPTKLYEYMVAGLPVIASDFPLWREIVLGNRCGLCVDPNQPRAIAEAIDYLLNHPDEARVMGANGKRAVLTKYNWNNEREVLLQLYRDLTQAP